MLQEWGEIESSACTDSNRRIISVSAYISVCSISGTINGRDSLFKSHYVHHKSHMKHPEIKPVSSMARKIN
jgi:hypothetical protein